MTRISRTSGFFALVGGLIQVVIPPALLFVPVFVTCIGQNCTRQTYIQMGGSFLGYILLIGVMALGAAVVLTHLDLPVSRKLSDEWCYRILWLAIAGSIIILILGAWSIGLAFLPGALFLLLAAFSRR